MNPLLQPELRALGREMWDTPALPLPA